MTRYTRLIIICCSLLCSMATFALPVDDITLVAVSPKAGELDAELRTLENITLMFSEEVQVGPKALVTLEMPNGETLEAVPEANRFVKKNCTVNFPGFIPYNGTFRLILKRWSVGDSDWIANREEGHSNPQCEVEWTISNGLDTGVEYDIEPISLAPANNAQFEYSIGQTLAQIKIVFPDGVLLNPEAKISLSCTEARFEQMLTFSAEKTAKNTAFTALVSPVPTVSGNYTLMIPGGSFGDEDFITGNGGHANPPIDYLYVVSGAQNGEGDMLETVYYTFEPNHAELSRDGDEYNYILGWSAFPVIEEKYLSWCRVNDEYGFAVDGATLTLTNDEDTCTSTFSFTAELEETKRYTILIAPSIFGNELWEESNHTLGETNPQLRYDFAPEDLSSETDHVDAVSTAGAATHTVYTLTGFLLYRDATDSQISALPKGFYIIAGHKHLVR